MYGLTVLHSGEVKSMKTEIERSVGPRGWGKEGRIDRRQRDFRLVKLLRVILPYFAVYNACFFAQVFEGKIRMCIIHE